MLCPSAQQSFRGPAANSRQAQLGDAEYAQGHSAIRLAGGKVISPLPVALVEGRRRAQPGTPDSLGAREAKVLHQVNQIVAQSKIRRHPVDRLHACISICGKVAVLASVARIVAASCACAASAHAAAMPPNRLMNSRLLIRSPRRISRPARSVPGLPLQLR